MNRLLIFLLLVLPSRVAVPIYERIYEGKPRNELSEEYE